MIFSGKIKGKACEQKQPLYMTLLDLTKVFKTLSQPSLWTVIRTIGCTEHFVNLITSFHYTMKTCVSFKGEVNHFFPISNGVKEGCVLAPPPPPPIQCSLQLNALSCRPGPQHWSLPENKSQWQLYELYELYEPEVLKSKFKPIIILLCDHPFADHPLPASDKCNLRGTVHLN